MPKNDKPGYWERSKRRAAVVTAGETGVGTTTKRGAAMIGAMLREAISPSESMPSRAHIRKAHKTRVKTKKAKQERAAATRRRPIERATGTARGLDALRKIARETKKGK